jgi:type II secretion system protein G
MSPKGILDNGGIPLYPMGSMAPKRRTTRLQSSAAFTLVEMLGVLSIIAILVGILFPAIATVRTKAKVAKAHATIQALSVALRMHESDLGTYPSSTASVPNALYTHLGKQVDSGPPLNITVGPYMEFKKAELGAGDVLNDPWGNPYIYVSRDGGPPVSTHNTNSFDLHSTGPDGPQGTIADDINNW